MLRRNFFKWLTTGVLPFFFPKLIRAQVAGLRESETPLVLELAALVLASSLGRTRTDEIGKQFVRWTQGYKAGADGGYGYGFPEVQVLGPNPASNYTAQLKELESAATARSGSFASLSVADKREIVAEALQKAKVDRMPPRPNGKHVVADLLAFFYNSSDGQDSLYNAAIKRDDCRGLATSAERPQRLV